MGIKREETLIFYCHFKYKISFLWGLIHANNKIELNNFAFLVLQFCDPKEDICLGLEQFYLDLHNPKYNILKLAGSSKGFKHSPDTIAKLKKIHSGKLHPRFNTEVSADQKISKMAKRDAAIQYQIYAATLTT